MPPDQQSWDSICDFTFNALTISCFQPAAVSRGCYLLSLRPFCHTSRSHSYLSVQTCCDPCDLSPVLTYTGHRTHSADFEMFLRRAFHWALINASALLPNLVRGTSYLQRVVVNAETHNCSTSSDEVTKCVCVKPFLQGSKKTL